MYDETQGGDEDASGAQVTFAHLSVKYLRTTFSDTVTCNPEDGGKEA